MRILKTNEDMRSKKKYFLLDCQDLFYKDNFMSEIYILKKKLPKNKQTIIT